MAAPSPKSDQLMKLKAAKWERQYGKGAKKAVPAPEKMEIAQKALKTESNKSNALSNKQQSNTRSFDKPAYQRDYMRKRRAEEKSNGGS